MVRPIQRAGSRKSGINSRDSTVTCHEIRSITANVSVSVTTLVMTPENVSEKARCAPITSLPSLLTSAPVRVRVKNAIGIFWTWSKTAVRRSRIRPSPIVEDSHRVTSDTPASATATPAITRASITTTPTAPSPISSTTRPANSGVARPRSALTTLTPTKTPNRRWCRAANRQIRVSSARSARDRRSPPLACVCRYRDCRATVSKLIESP